MTKLAVYPQPWELSDTCPCDVEFVDYLELKQPGLHIFHFGTGGHHLVGARAWRLGHKTTGWTASPEEMERYMRLASGNAELSAAYQVLFGDVYLMDTGMLPKFDIVTAFHFGEDYAEQPDGYPAMSDTELMLSFIRLVKTNGLLVLYKRSSAYWKAARQIEHAHDAGLIKHLHDFKSLQVFEKVR